VHPCNAHKRPYTKHGCSDATTDPKVIRGWWRRWPNAQIGVACGPSHLAVLDVDVDPSRGVNGAAVLEGIIGATPLGAGLVARTPRGGRHYYYRDDSGIYKTVSGRDGSHGLDVRAVGGYVIAPSPSSPGREWIEGDWTASDDLVQPPDHMAMVLPRRDQDAVSCPQHVATPTTRCVASDDRFAEVSSALACVDPSRPRSTWIAMIFAVKAALNGDPRGVDMVEKWSSTTSVPGQYTQGEASRIYKAARQPWEAQGAVLVDSGSLWHAASASGWTGWTPDSTPPTSSTQPPPGASPEMDDVPDDEIPPAEPFPLHLIDGDDLLSQISQHVICTALSPLPALALGNTIAFLGAVVGRRVKGTTNSRTNFYTVGVAGTAFGKEHSQTVMRELLSDTGMTALLGSGGWKSGSAVVTSVHSQPSQLVQIDELGKMLSLQSGRNPPPHLAEIRLVLMRMFSNASSVFAGDCYANPKENAQRTIVEPNLCYFGATTPEPFFAALQSGAIKDGFLNRHLVFFAEEKRPQRQRPSDDSQRRAELVRRLRNLEEVTRPSGIAGGGLGGLPTFGSGARLIMFDGEADHAWYAIMDAATAQLDALTAKGDRGAELWSRYAEHVAKLALLRAVARDPRAQVVTLADVQWADTLVRWTHDRMHREAERFVADNETEERVLRVLRLIDDAGQRGLTQTQLTRKTQWLTKREREDVCSTLAEAKQMFVVTGESERQDGKGKPKTTYFAWRYKR